MKITAKPLPLSMLPELRQVGKPLRRVDALSKTVGATVYAGDYYPAQSCCMEKSSAAAFPTGVSPGWIPARQALPGSGLRPDRQGFTRLGPGHRYARADRAAAPGGHRCPGAGCRNRALYRRTDCSGRGRNGIPGRASPEPDRGRIRAPSGRVRSHGSHAARRASNPSTRQYRRPLENPQGRRP